MEEELCRACLAPQGKVKHISIFTENGKIALDIYNLTNIVIFDIDDASCRAVICQRCLMDLERAISFRDLVINSDKHFKELFGTVSNKIVKQLVKEIQSEYSDKHEKDASLKIEQFSSEESEPEINIQSILKIEQFDEEEVEYDKIVLNTSNSKESTINNEQLDINDQTLHEGTEKVTKVRHKITKMRPNLNDLDEKCQNEGTNQMSQIFEDYNNDSKSGEKSTDETSDYYKAESPTYSQNLEYSMQLQDNSIVNESQTNNFTITFPNVNNPLYQESNSNKLKCPVCSKKFGKQSYLTQHFQTIHATFKPHKCKKCGKKFATIEELNHHEMKHVAVDKPFKCMYCPKSFIHKSDMKRHEFSHSVVKPFQCSMCHRGFARNDHLIKHEHVHLKKLGK